MGYRRWYSFAVLAFLVAAGLMAWLILEGSPAKDSDAAAFVSSALSVVLAVWALQQGTRARRLAETDATMVASRLAVAVGEREGAARRQLLGEHDQAIDVQFSFRPAPAHDAAAARSGSLQDVVGYYRKLHPQRMVITGAPGSGKTVLAIELILGLLDGREAGDPVPVLISAGLLETGAPASQAVQDLDGAVLAAGVPAEQNRGTEPGRRADGAAGHRRAGRDGRRRRARIRIPGRAGGPGVQCLPVRNAEGCHSADLPNRPLPGIAGRSGVGSRCRPSGGPPGEPCSGPQLPNPAGYRPDRWQPVLDALRGRGRTVLAEALSTPWRLALAATIYDARDHATGAFLRDPSELVHPGLATEDRVRDHLLSLFIPVTAQSRTGRYQGAEVHRWLGTLARYLGANATAAGQPGRVVSGRPLPTSDIDPHELWPLAGAHMPRVIADGLTAVPFLGIAAWLVLYADARYRVPIAATSWAIILFAAAWGSYSRGTWDKVRVLRFHHLRTRRGASNLWLGVLAGLLVALITGYAGWGLGGRVSGLEAGLASLILVAGGMGLRGGMELETDEYALTTPAIPTRNATTAELVVGFIVLLLSDAIAGLMLGFFIWLLWIAAMDKYPSTAASLQYVLLVGAAAGFMFERARWRYLALLLWTRRWSRHWLPWRLNHFLWWCYGAGLLRLAGISYQFRHRELQDYLARNPIPAGKGTDQDSGQQ